jgi:hypothetical protein
LTYTILNPLTDNPDNFITGEVFIDDYDRGVITTMGGCPNVYEIKELAIPANSMYVIKDIPGVSPPPSYEGVPVYFAFPDENIENKIMPSIIVRRDAITPALNRWHPGNLQYTCPTPGATESTVYNPITGQPIASGYNSYQQRWQAAPFDLLYNIQLRARYRNNLRAESMKLLHFVMKMYKPYTIVTIFDSLGRHRRYDAFMETPSAVDIMPDLDGKEANFNITLRVEGELDLENPFRLRGVTSIPALTQTFQTGG